MKVAVFEWVMVANVFMIGIQTTMKTRKMPRRREGEWFWFCSMLLF